jgi:tetratricopeptide (TPR) repeat protein
MKTYLTMFSVVVCIYLGTMDLALANAEVWTESYRLESLTRYEQAAEVLAPILKKEPKNEFIFLRLGWLDYLRGSHNGAIDNYKQALSVNDKSLDARLGLILPLLAQQRWKEAAKFAQEVLQTAPWNYYAHVRLMIAEEGMRQWQTLAKHADEVYLRYPSDATILVYLARANRWLGKVNEAKSAYQKVLQRIPGHIEALQYLEELK